DDEANAYVMYMNIRTTDGIPILHRVTIFKCDNCVIFIAMGFPDIPYHSKHELEVQMLDGEMKRVNITREREAESRNACNNKQAAARWRQRADSQLGQPVPLYYAQSRQIKVAKYFAKLNDTPDVLFETFSLLQRPHVIDGDVEVSDAQNTRIVVECLGANVQDGMALLLRKIRSEAPPTMDDMGNYLRPKVHDVDKEGGYMSLSEMISDDPETSDAGEWSRLL
ncbi:hypothetical protein LPJ59_003115, partial [Coemansia sp. RSA 2399]